MAIDFDTISAFEGGCRLRAYVPDAARSGSGVTVGTGVDLGARDEAELHGMGLPPSLVDKLRPYLGVRGEDAQRLVDETPLELTPKEARRLDAAVKGAFLDPLVDRYDRCVAPGLPRFADIPPEAQTVIASVAFQYGTDLERRTPRFWGLVTRQDWEGAVAELEDFRDRYPTRRRGEAKVLRRWLDRSPPPGTHAD